MNENAPEKHPAPIEDGLFSSPSANEKAHLIGNRCRSCGETFFPKRLRCRHCSSPDMEEVTLSRTGKLYSFTTIRMKLPHFIGKAPYMVGVVELPEGERVRTLLTDCDQDSLEIGMEVELVIESVGKTIEPVGRIEPGAEILGWKFKPVRRS